MVAMRICGLVVGSPTPFDGQFLVEYDPERDGRSPEGERMTAHRPLTAFSVETVGV